MSQGNLKDSINTSARLPKKLHSEFCKKYPKRGKRSDVIRALIQMHLDGKIQGLSFTQTI